MTEPTTTALFAAVREANAALDGPTLNHLTRVHEIADDLMTAAAVREAVAARLPLSYRMLLAAGEDLADAATWLNVGTATRTSSVPAPLAHDLLGSVQGTSRELAQWFVELTGSLRTSLYEYDVTEEDCDRDPAASVEVSAGHLEQAAQLAAELGKALGEARAAINGQSYNGTREAQR